jgi:hypothetical protein
MLDVTGGLFQVEGFEVIADGDALMEGLVGGEAEFVSQVRLAKQNEGEERSGVYVGVEQEAELVEEVGREEVSLVDDEKKETTLAGQVGEGGAELGQEADEAKSGFDLQGEEDLAVESGDAQVGVRQVGDGVDVVVEGVSKGPKGGGFAGADVTGDEGGQALLKGEDQPALYRTVQYGALDLAVAVGREQVFGGDGFGEGSLVKAIEVIEGGHRFPP